MKRYVLVGASHRALHMFLAPLNQGYRGAAEIVAIADPDPARIDLINRAAKTELPGYPAEAFGRMLDECRPDGVIVASPDATHHTYVIAALARDLDVICEKPLTTDDAKCRAILAAAAASKGKVTVTFNYRYAPVATTIRERILAGDVGRVVNVNLDWCLDTYHGSSYFMRWNRRREQSGGLSVHKATHHFDLVQWWIDQKPVSVTACGGRHFYGSDGPRNPRRVDGRHCPTCPDRAACAYYMRWHADEYRGAPEAKVLDEHVSQLQTMSHYTNYSARRCIYDSEIDIEDNYGAVVEYDGGAVMSYSLTCSAPYEGYRLAITGLNGRIETHQVDAGVRSPFPPGRVNPILAMPIFGGFQEIHPSAAAGGHGGADPQLRDALFLGRKGATPADREAGLMDGVLSVLTGVALHRSVALGRPVRIAELLEGRGDAAMP